MESTTTNTTQETQAPKKKSMARRLITWVIYVAVAVVVYNYVTDLRAEQKEKFVRDVKAAAVQQCAGDNACLASLDANFATCLSANHETRKSGRYNRKYILDEEGFYGCLASRR